MSRTPGPVTATPGSFPQGLRPRLSLAGRNENFSLGPSQRYWKRTISASFRKIRTEHFTDLMDSLLRMQTNEGRCECFRVPDMGPGERLPRVFSAPVSQPTRSSCSAGASPTSAYVHGEKSHSTCRNTDGFAHVQKVQTEVSVFRTSVWEGPARSLVRESICFNHLPGPQNARIHSPQYKSKKTSPTTPSLLFTLLSQLGGWGLGGSKNHGYQDGKEEDESLER